MVEGLTEKDVAIEYLSMIQSNISRMSTASAIFKGFAATVLAGVVTIAFRDISPVVLLLMFLPLLAFLMLDVYYLILEKKYRHLYQQVLTGEHACDLSMDVSSMDKAEAKATILCCLCSSSILLFYIPVFVAFAILVIMRFAGVQ